MSEFKGTPGPWKAEKVHGWGNDLCITAQNENRPILKAIKPKRYYTDYPKRIDDNGEEWTVCSTRAAELAGNYVATPEIREEIDAVEAANMHIASAAPELLDELIEADKTLCALQSSVADAQKREPRWEGVWEEIQVRRDSIRAAIAKALNTDTTER